MFWCFDSRNNIFRLNIVCIPIPRQSKILCEITICVKIGTSKISLEFVNRLPNIEHDFIYEVEHKRTFSEISLASICF